MASPNEIATIFPLSLTATILLSDEVQLIVLSVVVSGLIIYWRSKASPTLRVTSEGMTEIDSAKVGITVSSISASMSALLVALILTVPSLTAVTRPSVSTFAMELSEEVHLTDLSVALPGVTVAVSCIVSPTLNEVDSGVSISIPVAIVGTTFTMHLAVTLLPSAAVA